MSTVDDMVRNAKAVLFDFDGPICSVFSAYPAPLVAEQMREMLMTRTQHDWISQTEDPLNLLRWTGENRPVLVAQADDFLRAAERQAVLGAAPTMRAHDAIIAATHAGRLVAIVSNNSEAAIRDYLDLHQLEPYVACISGRPYAAPHRMKPSPESILRTTEALDVPPAACIFVGDSVTDAKASLLAGVNFIGYAKRADRIPALSGAGADVVVESMGIIADLLERL